MKGGKSKCHLKQFINYWRDISSALDTQFISNQHKISLLEDFLDQLLFINGLLLIQLFHQSLQFISN